MGAKQDKRRYPGPAATEKEKRQVWLMTYSATVASFEASRRVAGRPDLASESSVIRLAHHVADQAVEGLDKEGK